MEKQLDASRQDQYRKKVAEDFPETLAIVDVNAFLEAYLGELKGIGSGQRSRIDSATNAIELSKRGYGPEGTFMASDAYMPATDVVELAAKMGVRGIIYPLGSNMDQKVLELANEHGLIMIATRKPGSTEGGERCFLHR